MDATAQIIVAIATLVTAGAGAYASIMASRKAGTAVKEVAVVAAKVEEVHKATNSMSEKLAAVSKEAGLAEGAAMGRAEASAEHAAGVHVEGRVRAEGVEAGRAQVHAEQAVSPPTPGGIVDVRVAEVADVRVVQLGPGQEKDKDKKKE